MKKIITIFLILSSIFIISCDDDTTGGVTDPFGTGGIGGGTGNVTFTIGAQQGENGGILFFATPSVAVKITKVTCSLPAQNFNDVVEGDGTTIFNANESVGIEEYTGVTSGQQWTFKFEGTLASNNQAFNVTSNYTVP
ncbi:MAG: hypothetical protein IPM32_05695 [Ignavibacteriae bacterium]|nr:hypothetical protein [Ignavibacteriota bacterium]